MIFAFAALTVALFLLTALFAAFCNKLKDE